jgi:hypothetical protein
VHLQGVRGLRPTPVVLEVVDAPIGECLRVDALVPRPADARILTAALVERTVVDAQVHVAIVGVAGDSGYPVREARGVRLQLATPVAG